MDEKLRLQAEMRDNVSPGVRKIKKELDSIRTTPGMQEATKWFGNFETTAAGFVKSGGGAAGIIGAMGIGGLTAAASMSQLVTQFKELGEQRLALKELSRETGVTVGFLNAFTHAGNHFGVSAGSMGGALDHLAGQMPKFRNGVGELHDLMAGHWPDLTKKLQLEGAEDQIRDIFKQLDKMKDNPQLQKQWLDAMFGNGSEMEKLMQDGANGFATELNRQMKMIDPISPQLFANAKEFRDAVGDFNVVLENFENKAAPGFLKAMTTLLTEAKDFVQTVSGVKSETDKPFMEKSLGGKAGIILPPLLKAIPLVGPLNDLYINHEKYGNTLGKLWRSPEDNDAYRKRIEQEHKDEGEDDSFKGLRHKTSFITGGGDGGSLASQYGLDGIIAIGTKSGVLAAFREMSAGSEIGDGASGSGGGGAGGVTGRFGLQRPHRGGGGADPLDDGPRLKGQGAVTGGQGDRAMRAMSRLIGLGWTEEAAATAVGNAMQESSVKSDGPAGDHGTAHGMFQWREKRFDDLQRFAAKRGKPWKDFDTQIDFFDAESKSHGQGDWRKQTDLLRGNLYGKRFEAYGDNSFGTRLSNAQSALRHWRNGGKQLPPSLDASGNPRRATGLNPPANSGVVPQSPTGNIRADIHVHGNTSKTSIRSSGQIEAKLHRWPTMTEASDVG